MGLVRNGVPPEIWPVVVRLRHGEDDDLRHALWRLEHGSLTNVIKAALRHYFDAQHAGHVSHSKDHARNEGQMQEPIPPGPLGGVAAAADTNTVTDDGAVLEFLSGL